MCSSSRIYLGPLLFLLYINDTPQPINRELILYADTHLIFQQNDIKKLKSNLTKNLAYYVVGL